MSISSSIESALAVKLRLLAPTTVGISCAHATAAAVNSPAIIIDAKPVTCPESAVVPKSRLEVHFSAAVPDNDSNFDSIFDSIESAITGLLKSLVDAFFISQESDLSGSSFSVIGLAITSADSSPQTEESLRAFSSVLQIDFVS